MSGPDFAFAVIFVEFCVSGAAIGVLVGLPTGDLWGKRRRAYIDRLRADREFAERKLVELQAELEHLRLEKDRVQKRACDLAGCMVQARHLLGTAG